MSDNLQGFLYAPIAAGQPSDVVLSPNGSTLYVANTAGQILVYDVATRTLNATWNVGNTLGGIDISPDGSFLLVAEREPVAHHPATETTDASTTLTSYKVDTSTGDVTNLPVTITGDLSVGFYDVEVFNDGQARLTQEMYNTQVRELDIASGQYSLIGPTYGGQGVLVGSNDHTQALFTSQNQTPSELALFGATGNPISYWTGHQEPDYSHPADGILALSVEAGLIVQHQYIEWQGELHTSLLVFDDSFESFLDLTLLHPEWADGRISGLAFDATGANLYILDDDTDAIVQLATSDWSVVRNFQVGIDIGDFADGHFGNRLLITPDGRYFIVVTATGIQLVENGALANDFIGSPAADDLSAGLGDDAISGVGGNDHLRGDAGNDILAGGEGDDILDGGTGNDTLDGGADADLMTGGAGDDTYVVDHVGDQAVETASTHGVDQVLSSVSFALGARVENLTLTGTALINGTGNEGANILVGNGAANVLNGRAGADTMQGGAGNDTYVVENAADQVIEQAGEGVDLVQSYISHALAANVENLTLVGSASVNATGNALANTLVGNSAANILDGGAGADVMKGDRGNDTYVVDNAADQVIERAANHGTDQVLSSVSFSLAARVDNLTLTGMAAINATGNTGANILIGNAAGNILSGRAGADTMQGGVGDDIYVVENAADQVIEQAGEGTDLVESYISHTLAANVETLKLVGSASVNATGNATGNTLLGNAAANILDGGGGADLMTGERGNDTYVVDDALDQTIELASTHGTDLVLASISWTLAARTEHLTLTGSGDLDGTGNAAANVLTGNAGNNALSGLAGNDTLDGGAGQDLCIGGLGLDTFVFDEMIDFSGLDALTCDAITDFTQADSDRIDLSGLDANLLLDGDQAFDFIGMDAFTGTAGELRFEWSGGDTYVSGDWNGDAVADFMIRLDGLEALQASDFGP